MTIKFRGNQGRCLAIKVFRKWGLCCEQGKYSPTSVQFVLGFKIIWIKSIYIGLYKTPNKTLSCLVLSCLFVLVVKVLFGMVQMA